MEGLVGIKTNIFGRHRSMSANPACIFVWKVPIVPDKGTHTGDVQQAVDECRQRCPKLLSAESVRRVNNILRKITDVPAGVRKALTNYLFKGETDAHGEIPNEYCIFVENLAAGLPVDESLIVDGRAFNSRGGKGIGFTKYTEFWDVCHQ